MKIDKSWYIKPENKNFPTRNLAGGIVVRWDKGMLFVALLGDKRFTEFSLPKGGIEGKESEIRAAKREISEELGLQELFLVEKLGVKKRFSFDKTSWNTYHYFLFQTQQESGTQNLSKEEKDLYLKWFDLEKLPQIFWPEQKELIDENKEKIIRLLDKNK